MMTNNIQELLQRQITNVEHGLDALKDNTEVTFGSAPVEKAMMDLQITIHKSILDILREIVNELPVERGPNG